MIKEASKIKKATDEFLALIENIGSSGRLIEEKKKEIILLLTEAQRSRDRASWVLIESEDDIGPFGLIREVKPE